MIAGLLCGLLFAISAVPLGAQPAPTARPYYDIAKEVTLNGTVSSVLRKGTAGTGADSHLLLRTSSGAVDASLGRWGLQGKGALSVTAGQRVAVTGIMKTVKNNKEIFVARTVTVNGHVYTMRNQHGIPLSPLARARAGQSPRPFNSRAAQKGESL
jgi:hypothetical protein